MKNMKVATKLALSFLILMILGGGIGSANIIVLRNLGLASTDMYENKTSPLSNMSKIIETLQQMRVSSGEYVIGAALNDQKQIENAHTAIENYQTAMVENLNSYRASMRDEEEIKLFDEARNLYDTGFKEGMQKIYESAGSGTSVNAVYTLLAENAALANKITKNFEQCMEYKIQSAIASSQNSTKMANMVIAILIPVLAFALLTAVTLTLYVSGIISKPLVVMSSFLDKVAESGDMTLSDVDLKAVEVYSTHQDEIGRCVKSCNGLIRRLLEVNEKLGKVADGDLTGGIKVLSAQDSLGLAINRMLGSLNNMFGEINASSVQVSNGAKQIANGAQALAQGSTEQASAAQELSASISEIADKTNQNASIARTAVELSDIIRSNAEKGSMQMDQMMLAVREITEASSQIEKVIKVIDEIAFQTNILALNASVEAARAGQHGKGFAVVAEEVRNLAVKSAEAAKDTGALIEDSIGKANFGLNIATATADSLKEIVEGINRSAEIVTRIARLSDEQASTIVQVHTGIDQVAQVIQQNSTTAEKSAAASVGMSKQSQMLAQLIARFKLKGDNTQST